jgi:hypothetical protein
MIGSDGPTRGDDVLRYYITRREAHYPTAGAPKERIRADLVEGEVRAAVRVALQDFELHAQKIVKFVEDKKRELRGKTDDSAGLRAEKAELEEWYKKVFSLAGTRGQSVLADEAHRVEQRLDQIEVQLAEMGAAPPEYLDVNVEDIIASIKHQFAQLPAVVDAIPSLGLRRLVEIVCSKIEFDPVDRTVGIEVALPSWVLSKRHLILDRVGTEITSDSTYSPRTNNDYIVMSSISCGEKRNRNIPCLECSRSPDRAAAA